MFFLLRPCRVRSTVQSSRDEHPKAPEARELRGPRGQAEAAGAQRSVMHARRGLL